jgi:soluble cytochrome b562
MKKLLLLPACIAAHFAVLPAPTFAAEDARQFVKMPPEARAELRAEMLDFQTALHLIVGALGEGKLADAAATAESQIGISAMGRHRTAPANARPGMFMSNDMHAIARGMHGAGSDFAKVAKAGDAAKAYAALTAVTGACVACHRSYRTQ